jgi:hypothetical protein
MRNAIIAAIVSASIASTGAVAATVLVTSADIKNGTIQLVDISGKAKRALKGKRGPVGAPGRPGAQGAQGPQGAGGAQGQQGVAGPAGFSSLHFVRTADIPNPANTAVTAAAQCPDGQYPLGGGANTTSELQYVNDSFAAHSGPDGPINLWVASVKNLDGADTHTFRVYAVCAPAAAVDGNY